MPLRTVTVNTFSSLNEGESNVSVTTFDLKYSKLVSGIAVQRSLSNSI